MSYEKLNKVLSAEVKALEDKGTAKGAEMVIEKVIPAKSPKGPRYNIRGYGDKEFIKMNSNSYLGLSQNHEVIEAEEKAALEYGVGPGAVRFISGTYDKHIELEERLAAFHGREEAMIFSSAYVTSMGVIVPLATKETVFVSDELNHNCIIQAMRLSRPAGKFIYKHNDMEDLEAKLIEAKGTGKRVLLVTDGVFSMRGDYAPMKTIEEIAAKHNDDFEEGIITIADDSHGIGAYGETGHGTEEVTGSHFDIIIGTLGKAFGVNGGYVVTSKEVIRYLRETAPMYIYSNPITCSECAAVLKVLDILESPEGKKRLKHLSEMTARFEKGLVDNGMETIAGPHPVTPLMVRNTEKTSKIVEHLKENGILATGLNFPVVPKGDEEIRFQINGDHTAADIDEVLNVLAAFK